MATFYWQGQSITGIAKFDWNCVGNWKTTYFNYGGTGPSWGWQYIGATACPGVNDAALFGVSASQLPPLNALSPCLFGGFSGNVSGGVWLGSGTAQAGTIANSSITSVLATLKRGATGNTYPFAYFGGGLTAEVLSWLISYGEFSGETGSLQDDSILERWAGFSGDQTSPAGISGGRAMAQRSRLGTKLKVSDTLWFRHDSDKSIMINGVKSLQDVAGTTGTTRIVKTNFISDGKGSVSLISGVYATIYNYGVGSSLYMKGLTCGYFSTVPTATYIEPDVKFNRVEVAGQYTNPIWFGGTLDTPSVINELGGSGLGTTGIFQAEDESSILIRPIFNWWSGGGLQGQPQPYFVFGIPGLTSQLAVAKKIEIASVDGSLSGSTTGTAAWNSTWNLTFAGGASAGTIKCDSAIVRVLDGIDTTTTVSIGSIFMDKGSILDLASGREFDNWFFGSISGNSIQGGIVFEDENSIVKGSNNIRLFNTQVGLGNRLDVRTAKKNSNTLTLGESGLI